MRHYTIEVKRRDSGISFRVETPTVLEISARTLFDLLRAKFPSSEGYDVTIIAWEDTGTFLNW